MPHWGCFFSAGLLSLLIGTALWDPGVPRSDNLIVVQIAQWAVFAFSAAAFWLTGNLIRMRPGCGGSPFSSSASLVRWQSSASCPSRVVGCKASATFALDRAPFWLLLTALAGGQLIFNRALSTGWRLFLVASLAAAVAYALFSERATVSNWVAVLSAVGMLAWLRFPAPALAGRDRC